MKLSGYVKLVGLAFALIACAEAVLGIVSGLDLGVGWYKISHLSNRTQKIEIALSREAERKIKSVVAFDSGISYFGLNAEPIAYRAPQDFIPEIVELLGAEYDDPIAVKYRERNYNKMIKDPETGRIMFELRNGLKYGVEEILSLILKNASSVALFDTNYSTSKMAVVVPMRYGIKERKVVMTAAQLEDVDVISVTNAPEAVAINYGLKTRLNKPKTYIMYDMGYSNTEATVFRLTSPTYTSKEPLSKVPLEVTILGTSWTDYGGRDLDYAISDKVIDDFLKANPSISEANIKGDKTLYTKLLEEMSRAKSILTAGNEARITIEEFYNGIPLRTIVKRIQIDAELSKVEDKLISPVKSAIKKSGLKPEDINYLMFFGGSARIPFVRSAVQNNLKDSEVIKNVNQEDSAALGAGTIAALYSKAFRARPVSLKYRNHEDYILIHGIKDDIVQEKIFVDEVNDMDFSRTFDLKYKDDFYVKIIRRDNNGEDEILLDQEVEGLTRAQSLNSQIEEYDIDLTVNRDMFGLWSVSLNLHKEDTKTETKGAKKLIANLYNKIGNTAKNKYHKLVDKVNKSEINKPEEPSSDADLDKENSENPPEGTDNNDQKNTQSTDENKGNGTQNEGETKESKNKKSNSTEKRKFTVPIFNTKDREGYNTLSVDRKTYNSISNSMRKLRKAEEELSETRRNKSDLELFAYELKSGDRYDDLIKYFSRPQEAQNIKDFASEYLAWLDDIDVNENGEEIYKRLKNLRKLVGDLEHRESSYKQIQDAVKQLKTTLNTFKGTSSTILGEANFYENEELKTIKIQQDSNLRDFSDWMDKIKSDISSEDSRYRSVEIYEEIQVNVTKFAKKHNDSVQKIKDLAKKGEQQIEAEKKQIQDSENEENSQEKNAQATVEDSKKGESDHSTKPIHTEEQEESRNATSDKTTPNKAVKNAGGKDPIESSDEL